MHPEPTLSYLGHCPQDERLRSFAEAILPSSEMDAIQLHLAKCDDCLVALDAFDDHSDTIVQVLSSLPSTPDDESEYVQLRERLHREPIQVASGDCPTLGVDETDRHDSPGQYPQRLGGYELLDLLGRGASGAVFRARHLKLDRVFAVKLLNSRQALRDPQALIRFQREVRAVGQLDHPNIVRATDAGEDAGRHFLVMEYVDGVDLSMLLRLNGPLRVADACELARQAAIALQFAHDHKMVHRDVKPSNLFLTRDGTVKLLDLGLASLDGALEPSDEADLPFGTGDYMPPEQWTNFRGVDGRADVYSLGCSLYKLLCGKAVYPTERRDYAAKMSAHCSNPVPNVRHLRPEIPLGLQKLVKKMLAKRPDDRYETMEEVADHLQTYAVDARLPSLAAKVADLPEFERARATTPTEQPAVLPRRKALRRIGIASLAIAPITGWILFQRTRNRPALAPNVWRPLTATAEPMRFPVVADTDAIPDSEPPTGVQSDTETNAVQLASNGMVSIVEYGTPVHGRFSLRGDMRLDRAKTRAGFFLRYRPARTREGRSFPFQAIEFVSHGDETHSLCWGRYRFIEQADGRFEMDRFDWSRVPIRPASDSEGQFHRIQITVGRTGIPQVIFDEQPIAAASWKSELSFEGRHASTRTTNQLRNHYLGRLGVLVRHGVASFANIQLAYLD